MLQLCIKAILNKVKQLIKADFVTLHFKLQLMSYKKWFFAHYLENCLSQSFYISHAYWSCQGLDPIEFIFLKSKVTRVTFCKQWFPLIFEKNIYHRSFIIYVLIGLGKDKTIIDFGLTRSKDKVKSVTFVNMFFAHYFENWLILSFHISLADWSWRGHMSWCI